MKFYRIGCALNIMKKTTIMSMGAMAAISLVLLSGCGSSSKDIVTMKGGAITQQEYYDRIKTQSQNEQVLQQMIIYKVAEEQYGSKVSKADVNKKYKQMEKSYGKENFKSALKQAGYTESSYKKELRSSLCVQKMLDANIKVSNKDLKKAWKDYHPEVTVSIIQVSDENKANDLANQVKEDPNKFADLAKENSVDTTTAEKGGKTTFSSASSEIPDSVKQEAWKMKDGDVSGVITAEQSDATTLQTVKSYYIIKMDKQSDKGNDMNKYKKQLTKIVKDQKLQDSETIRKIFKKELKKANVKIKDKDLDSVLSSFMSNTNTQSNN